MKQFKLFLIFQILFLFCMSQPTDSIKEYRIALTYKNNHKIVHYVRADTKIKIFTIDKKYKKTKNFTLNDSVIILDKKDTVAFAHIEKMKCKIEASRLMKGKGIVFIVAGAFISSIFIYYGLYLLSSSPLFITTYFEGIGWLILSSTTTPLIIKGIRTINGKKTYRKKFWVVEGH